MKPYIKLILTGNIEGKFKVLLKQLQFIWGFIKKMKKNEITSENLAYVAGFLDGDGCILAQIVPGKQYKHKFTIRVSVTFYQKIKRH